MVTWRHCFSIKLPQATWLVTLFLWGLNDSQLFSEDLGRFLKSHRILTSYMHQICPEERIDSHKKNCSQSLQLWECLADVFTSVCNIVRRLTSRENGCVRAYLQTSDAQWDMGFGNQQLNENDPLAPQRKKKKETAKIYFVGLGQSWKNWADKTPGFFNFLFIGMLAVTNAQKSKHDLPKSCQKNWSDSGSENSRKHACQSGSAGPTLQLFFLSWLYSPPNKCIGHFQWRRNKQIWRILSFTLVHGYIKHNSDLDTIFFEAIVTPQTLDLTVLLFWKATPAVRMASDCKIRVHLPGQTCREQL